MNSFNKIFIFAILIQASLLNGFKLIKKTEELKDKAIEIFDNVSEELEPTIDLELARLEKNLTPQLDDAVLIAEEFFKEEVLPEMKKLIPAIENQFTAVSNGDSSAQSELNKVSDQLKDVLLRKLGKKLRSMVPDAKESVKIFIQNVDTEFSRVFEDELKNANISFLEQDFNLSSELEDVKNDLDQNVVPNLNEESKQFWEMLKEAFYDDLKKGAQEFQDELNEGNLLENGFQQNFNDLSQLANKFLEFF